MAKAIWNGEVIAESNDTIFLEGSYCFPPESVKKELLVEAEFHTTCPWKGEASYYDIRINDQTKENAAWSYPHPKSAASHIKNYFAFWRGVEIEI